ncbi:hypothetical protein HK102_010273, partial [Quaeritorhiza haematococci]
MEGGRPATEEDTVVMISLALPKKLYPGAEITVEGSGAEFFETFIVLAEALEGPHFRAYVANTELTTVLKISLTRAGARRAFGNRGEKMNVKVVVKPQGVGFVANGGKVEVEAPVPVSPVMRRKSDVGVVQAQDLVQDVPPAAAPVVVAPTPQ